MPRYWLGIALGGLTLLALVEIGLRTGLIAPEDPRLLAVRDALLAPNPSAAFGDSHVGRDQSLGGRMLFTGFGGATFFEIDRVIAQYYRRLRPERVILAVGPQMFARYRQKTWRQMPAGVFAMQVLPFPLLILEPTLVGAFTQILAPEPHLGAARGRGMSLHQRAFARLLAAQGETAFAAAPRRLRHALARSRVEDQRPVAAVPGSVAWQHLLSVLDRLERLEATVCLVVTPVAPAYRKRLGPRYHAAIDGVRAEAGRRGIPFRHYADLGLPLQNRHFLNQDHLNQAGKSLYWPAAHAACFGGSGSEGGAAAFAELGRPRSVQGHEAGRVADPTASR